MSDLSLTPEASPTDPVDEASALDELVEPSVDVYVPPAPPKSIDFDSLCIAIKAYMAPNGYAEGSGYAARKAGQSGERKVVLSIPAMHGGHDRYEVTFPEAIKVSAVAVE